MGASERTGPRAHICNANVPPGHSHLSASQPQLGGECPGVGSPWRPSLLSGAMQNSSAGAALAPTTLTVSLDLCIIVIKYDKPYFFFFMCTGRKLWGKKTKEAVTLCSFDLINDHSLFYFRDYRVLSQKIRSTTCLDSCTAAAAATAAGLNCRWTDGNLSI